MPVRTKRHVAGTYFQNHDSGIGRGAILTLSLTERRRQTAGAAGRAFRSASTAEFLVDPQSTHDGRGHRRGGTGAGVRPLLPRDGRPLPARFRARPFDRVADRRRPSRNHPRREGAAGRGFVHNLLSIGAEQRGTARVLAFHRWPGRGATASTVRRRQARSWPSDSTSFTTS